MDKTNERITPRMVELRSRIEVKQIQEAIESAFDVTDKRQMLLVAWKGTESARFALIAMNQSKGWVGQYDALVGWLNGLIKSAVKSTGNDPFAVPTLGWKNASAKEAELTEAVTQHVCEHGDYKLPLMLIIWNPDDSTVFQYHFANMSLAWVGQMRSLIAHMSDLGTFTRQETWIQQEMIAQQQATAKQPQIVKPGIVLPNRR
jgi:hypothetical protein